MNKWMNEWIEANAYFESLFRSSCLLGGGEFLSIGKIVDSNRQKYI